jgi:hypothetical protein
VANLKLLHHPPNARKGNGKDEESIGGMFPLSVSINEIQVTDIMQLARIRILDARQSCCNNLINTVSGLVSGHEVLDPCSGERGCVYCERQGFVG